MPPSDAADRLCHASGYLFDDYALGAQTLRDIGQIVTTMPQNRRRMFRHCFQNRCETHRDVAPRGADYKDRVL